MKNIKLSQLDTNQIIQRKFDEENDAERVVLVGENLTIDSDKIVNAIKEGIKDIRIQAPEINFPEQKNPELIEKHIFIPKIEMVEVPVILKEIEYREIERPIYIEKIITIEKPIFITEIKEIEKQIIVKEIEIREIKVERHYPFILKVTAVAQVVLMLGILLINLLRR